MWHFMNREVQKDRVDPVRSCIPPSNVLCAPSELIFSNHPLIPQLENARAVMDLYRSAAADLEVPIAAGNWQFHLPPENFAGCYL